MAAVTLSASGVTPLGDRVLVKVSESEETTAGGIPSAAVGHGLEPTFELPIDPHNGRITTKMPVAPLSGALTCWRKPLASPSAPRAATWC
jgi:hypothetical protein